MDTNKELSAEIEPEVEDEFVFELGDVSEETKGGWFFSASEGSGGSWYLP